MVVILKHKKKHTHKTPIVCEESKTGRTMMLSACVAKQQETNEEMETEVKEGK